MPSYNTIALAAIASLAMIQPAPAFPAAIAGLVSSARPLMKGILAAAGSGAVAGGVSGAVGQMGDDGQPQKRADGSIIETLQDCFAQATENPPTGTPGPGDSIIINGLPQSCMAQVQAYNAHPANAAMAAVHGTVDQINSTAVKLDNMPKGMFQDISEMVKAQPEEESVKPQRRAMRFEKY